MKSFFIINESIRFSSHCNLINSDILPNIKNIENYDIFNYFKELDTTSSYQNNSINKNNNSLKLYEYLFSLPYFIGYLKNISSLNINIYLLLNDSEKYLKYCNIISMLQNKALIKSLIIDHNITKCSIIYKKEFI